MANQPKFKEKITVKFKEKITIKLRRNLDKLASMKEKREDLFFLVKRVSLLICSINYGAIKFIVVGPRSK